MTTRVQTDYYAEWWEFTPKEAVEHGLVCVEDSPVRGPVNELGEECPWPWEPEQLAGAPLGQYHCGYCGGMQLAGVPHSDQAADLLDDETKRMLGDFPHPRALLAKAEPTPNQPGRAG